MRLRLLPPEPHGHSCVCSFRLAISQGHSWLRISESRHSGLPSCEKRAASAFPRDCSPKSDLVRSVASISEELLLPNVCALHPNQTKNSYEVKRNSALCSTYLCDVWLCAMDENGCSAGSPLVRGTCESGLLPCVENPWL